MNQPEVDYALIGARIALFREAAQLSQADLAHQLGLARSSVTNIESGNQRLPLHTLYRIGLFLGVEPVDLLPDSDAPVLSSAAQPAADLLQAIDLSDLDRAILRRLLD